MSTKPSSSMLQHKALCTAESVDAQGRPAIGRDALLADGQVGLDGARK